MARYTAANAVAVEQGKHIHEDEGNSINQPQASRRSFNSFCKSIILFADRQRLQSLCHTDGWRFSLINSKYLIFIATEN